MTPNPTHAATLHTMLAAQRGYLLRFARQRLADAALAEDLVQETLLAALQGVAAFEGKATLRTWLTGILLRRLADHLRRQQRSPVAASYDDTQGGEGQDSFEAAGLSHAIADHRDPARLLEGRQFVEALRHGLERLPALAARVFTLREIDGLSNEEAARELGIAPDRCALLLHRGRLRLRSALRQRWARGPLAPAAA